MELEARWDKGVGLRGVENVYGSMPRGEEINKKKGMNLPTS